MHRYRIFISGDLVSRADRPEFIEVKSGQTTYFGPVNFQMETGEPMIIISEPVIQWRDGSHRGALVAELRLKPIWDLLARITTEQGQGVYILDRQGRVVAHPDPSVVLRNTRRTDKNRKPGIGLDGTEVVSASKMVRFGNQDFEVVAEKSRSEALALTRTTIRVVGLLTALSLLMAAVLMLLMMRQFIRPVRHLVGVAEAIEKGEMNRRAKIASNDEMGLLAQAFNRMTGRLRRSLDELELEVAERRKAESELKESEERYRTVVDNAEEALIVTRNRKVEFYNPSAVSLSGYTEAEFRLLAHDFANFVHPEDRNEVIKNLQKIQPVRKTYHPTISESSERMAGPVGFTTESWPLSGTDSPRP